MTTTAPVTAAPQTPTATLLAGRLDNLLTNIRRVNNLRASDEYEGSIPDAIAAHISMAITTTYQASREFHSDRPTAGYENLCAAGSQLSVIFDLLDTWREETTDPNERAVVEAMIAAIDTHWANEE